MGKSKTIGTLYTELALRDKMSAGLDKAGKKLDSFSKKTARKAAAYTFAGLATAATVSSAALIAGTKHTLESTDALTDLAAQTGVNVASAMKFQRAYKDGGREVEMFGKDISKMQNSIAEAALGTGKDPFAVLGLSAKELIKLNPEDQFNRVGASLMRIANVTERTSKIREIFGKQGAGLVTVFGGFKDAEKALGRMPELAARFGAAMNDANDTLGHLPLKSDQFFMGFTSGIIGELLPALKQIDEHDFTTFGENLGKAIGFGIESLTDGKAWELFSLQGERALNKLGFSADLFKQLFGAQGTDSNSGSSVPGIKEITNAWGAGINSMIEGLTPTDSPNYNWSFWETFQKYSEAGQAANTEIANDLDKKIADLSADISAKYEAKQNTAAGMGAVAPIVNPISLMPKALPAVASLTDEYMRRGLQLGNSPTMAGQDKQEEMLKVNREMLMVMKRIAESPEARAALF